jgi:hypothetical protein
MAASGPERWFAKYRFRRAHRKKFGQFIFAFFNSIGPSRKWRDTPEDVQRSARIIGGSRRGVL